MSKQEILKQAHDLYQSNFNNLPFEIRKSIASPIDRINEIDIAIKLAEKHLDELKNRRRELEQWLIEWYNTNKK